MRTFFVPLAVLLTAVTSYFAFRPQSSGTVAFWVLAGGPSLALGCVAGGWGEREGLLREWLSPKWGDFTRGVLGAGLLFAAAWGFARVVTPVGSPREIWLVTLYGQLGDPRVLQAHAPAIAATLIAASLAEELVWRGMVTHLLDELLGSRCGWLGAALLYAVSYAPTAWSLRADAGGEAGLNPALIIAALGAGVLFGGMARVFGRLAPGILAHALFDWAVVMMIPLWGIR